MRKFLMCAAGALALIAGLSMAPANVSAEPVKLSGAQLDTVNGAGFDAFGNAWYSGNCWVGVGASVNRYSASTSSDADVAGGQAGGFTGIFRRGHPVTGGNANVQSDNGQTFASFSINSFVRRR